MYFGFKEKSMTCVRKKIRLIVVPLWVHHCHSPFQQQEWAVLIWKDILLGIFVLLLKHKNTSKNMLLHKPVRNQNISQSAILQCFLTALSQNHTVSRVGRDLFIQTVYLLIYGNYRRKLQINYPPRNTTLLL